MTTIKSARQCLRLAVLIGLVLGAHAEAQERAGVVTTLEGNATVSRASLPSPAPLKFKDDIYVRDRIATGGESIARILLGGRAVVTVRERSVVTITEVPGVSTVDVVAGRAAVAVLREKMRPGDLVEVKTPNAVAGIRGTVIVAEVFDAQHSRITVLKGVIDVTRLDGGRPQIVTALQRVSVDGQAPVSMPQTITPDAAKSLGQEFRVAPPRTTPPDVTNVVTQTEVERTAAYIATLAPAVNPPSGDSDDKSANKPDKGDKAGDKADKADKPDKADKGDKGPRNAVASTGGASFSGSGSSGGSSGGASGSTAGGASAGSSGPSVGASAAATVAPVSAPPATQPPALSSAGGPTILQVLSSAVDAAKGKGGGRGSDGGPGNSGKGHGKDR